MKSSRSAIWLVLAFGGLLALIALVVNYGLAPPASNHFVPTDAAMLQGRWKTRTVAEDDLNGAYSGRVVFGADYYEITNPVVKVPVRIDDVRYQLEGNEIEVWVEGERSVATRVTLLRPDRGRIQLPGDNLILYMYREPVGDE